MRRAGSSPLGPLLAAFAFLTRLPLPRFLPGPGALEASLVWFPAVGAAVGALAALALLAAGWLWPWPLPALAAVAVAVAATGGFHEDGLADTADAFAAGGDLERRLRVLDDPRVGAVGAVVLALVLLGRVAALALLPLAAAAAVLVAAHTLARWSVPALLWRLPYVRGEAGIAARLKRGATGGRLVAATAIALALVLAAAALAAALPLPARFAAPSFAPPLLAPPARVATPGGSAAPAGPSFAPPLLAPPARMATPGGSAAPVEPAAPAGLAAPVLPVTPVEVAALRPSPPPPRSTGSSSPPHARRAPLSAAAGGAALAATLLVTVAAGGLFRRRFGGVTGDLLGATCQAVELAVYLAVLAAAGRGW